MQKLFLEIVELPREHWATAVLRECGDDVALKRRLEELLAAHDRPDSLLDQPVDPLAQRLDSESQPQPDPVTGPAQTLDASDAGSDAATADYHRSVESGLEIAGRYTLLQKIGEGGMGEVWVAQQTQPVKRKVALKLVKKGMDSEVVLARFEQERQALAMMDHPNIAHVMDGGITPSGQPFFVMELVNGLSVTKFCDNAKLSPHERLELFIPVCHAVQHAHQKGIGHRDLKPANILVTMIDGKPVPKVIDFGVAKATGGKLTGGTLATQFGAVIGTLEYMSPEQAGFSGVDVDTRSDIYSLGVLLYELLTGLRPIDSVRLRQAAFNEMVRIIREKEPSKPSTRLSTDESLPTMAALRQTEPRKLTALLRGELDWIVLKCLEKARDRRYETANGLAREIQRYLNDEPVEARPPSTRYRLGKFLRRNRGPVTAAGFVAIALLAGIVGTTWVLVEARKQKKIAIREVAEKELARQAAAERAEGERLVKLAAEASEVEAKKQQELASVNAGEAVEQRKITALNEKTARQRLEQLEKATASLAGVFKNLSPYSEEKEGLPLRQILARNLVETADSLKSLSDSNPLALARMQSLLGSAMADLGDNANGTKQLEQALATFQSTSGPDDPESLNVASQLALAYRAADRAEDSIALLVDTLERSKATRGMDDLDTLGYMNNLAIAYKAYGNMEKAMPLYLESEARVRARMGDDDQATLAATNDLAMAYMEMGQLDQALPLLVDTLDRSRKVLATHHPFTLNTMNNLANLYGQAAKLDQSILLYVEALAGRREQLGPTHPLTLQSMHSLGLDYTETKQPANAIPVLEETLAGRQARLGPDHRSTMRTMQVLGEAYLASGEIEKGLQMMSDLLVPMDRLMGPDHPDTLYLMNNLAASCWRAGQFDKSVPLFEKLLPLHQSKMGADHPLTINVQANLGVNLRDAGRIEEAIAILEDAVQKLDRHPPLNVARLAWIHSVMNATWELAGNTKKPNRAIANRGKTRLKISARTM